MSDAGPPLDAPASTDFSADATQPPLLVCVVPFRLAGGTLEIGIGVGPDGHHLLTAAPGIAESLDMTAHRIVSQASGRRADYLEQLYTFSPRSGMLRQVVITYIALFRHGDAGQDHPLVESGTPFTWMPARDAILRRGFDRTVVDYAVVRLRAKFGYTTIAFHLLPETFTLTDLQQAYEAVLGHAVDKRNFRRRMSLTGILADTGEQRRDGSHRPAALYRFATRDDQAAYLTPSWASERPSSPTAATTTTTRSGDPE
ncbi:MAG: NUDIX hydrolase [Thermomicrobiales bacterium]